jgi:hypothetical protein
MHCDSITNHALSLTEDLQPISQSNHSNVSYCKHFNPRCISYVSLSVFPGHLLILRMNHFNMQCVKKNMSAHKGSILIQKKKKRQILWHKGKISKSFYPSYSFNIPIVLHFSISQNILSNIMVKFLSFTLYRNLPVIFKWQI